ncbi:uncharacterized protein BXZ73DRAFT_101512 [Epithele typhae]|uniref:uncharacterized protein n=1 Tax=Epithele typhae TaxID=378194 RepID=UPI002007FE98|nr:uncharacterized protein BXZ73DRAFT_101512 [Epithele typhae]KAH9932141.1 hypothetical protein BXZ73DRAFT_101512 [Epithele typhae]
MLWDVEQSKYVPKAIDGVYRVDDGLSPEFLLGAGSAFFNAVFSVTFLADLATFASAQGIHVMLYSGENESLNMTFGGTEGSTRRLSMASQDDSGALAGIVRAGRVSSPSTLATSSLKPSGD